MTELGVVVPLYTSEHIQLMVFMADRLTDRLMSGS